MIIEDICKKAITIRDGATSILDIRLCDNGYEVTPAYEDGCNHCSDAVYLFGFDGELLADNYMDTDELKGNVVKFIEVPDKYRAEGYITIAEWEKMAAEEEAELSKNS